MLFISWTKYSDKVSAFAVCVTLMLLFQVSASIASNPSAVDERTLDSLRRMWPVQQSGRVLVLVPLYEYGCYTCIKSTAWVRRLLARTNSDSIVIAYFAPGKSESKLTSLRDAKLVHERIVVADKSGILERIVGSSRESPRVLVWSRGKWYKADGNEDAVLAVLGMKKNGN